MLLQQLQNRLQTECTTKMMYCTDLSQYLKFSSRRFSLFPFSTLFQVKRIKFLISHSRYLTAFVHTTCIPLGHTHTCTHPRILTHMYNMYNGGNKVIQTCNHMKLAIYQILYNYFIIYVCVLLSTSLVRDQRYMQTPSH